MDKFYQMNFRKEFPRRWVATYCGTSNENLIKVPYSWGRDISKELLMDYGIESSLRDSGGFYNIIIKFRTNADEAAFMMKVSDNSIRFSTEAWSDDE